MSKSSAMRHLRAALSLSRASARTGVPAAEIAEASAERRLSRRRFGLGALTLLAPACGPIRMPPERLEGPGAPVAIVGAGLAGLACAYRLRKLGVPARIFEASGRVGGRVWTERARFPGAACELGGEFFDSGHAEILGLARELGVDLLDLEADDAALASLVVLVGGRRLPLAEVVEGLGALARSVDASLATLGDPALGVTARRPNGAERLDAMSIAGWLDAAGAGGPVRKLVEVAFTTEFGLDVEVSSALNLLLLLRAQGSSEPELYGESDERYRAAGGSDQLTRRLAEAVGQAGIEPDARLEALRERPGGGYLLSFARGTGSFEIAADRVVLALPFSVLRRVAIDLPLSPGKRAAIDELGYGTNAKLLGAFRGRPWRAAGSTGAAFTDLPAQSTWETTRLQPTPDGVLTNFVGGALGLALGLGSPRDAFLAFLPQCEAIFPGSAEAATGRFERMHWPSYPHVGASYSAYRVGQYTRFAGLEAEPFENVFFAGEHTSLEAQGYMEGAALSGRRAADAVAASLGGPAREPALQAPRARVSQ